MKALLSSAAKTMFRIANMNSDEPRRLLRGLPVGKLYVVNPCHDPGMYLGTYEYELREHFHRLLKQGMRSFDIGSQYGFYALGINSLTRSEVLCVEPRPAARDRLQRNLKINGLCFPIVDAFVGAEINQSSTTIDGLAAQFFVPDFIKMDIEGGEYKALLGAKQVVGGRNPAMIIETHSAELEAECVGLLRKAGYTTIIVKQRRFMRESRTIPHNRWVVAQPRD